GRKYSRNAEVDIQLDLEPACIPYLENALNALNSSKVDQELIMDHLLDHVQKQKEAEEQSRNIQLFDIDQYILRMIPVYIKTGADRPDNLATYYHQKNQSGKIITAPVDKIKKKAKENIHIFNKAELQMLTDGPDFYASEEIMRGTADQDSESDFQF